MKTILLALFLATSAHAAAPTLFAPGVISGPLEDTAPTFTADGKTVYFSRANGAFSAIMVSHWKSGHWSEPRVAPFSGTWSDLEPAFSPDRKFLVFASNRPPRPGGAPLDGQWGGKSYPHDGGNLWRVELRGNDFGEAVRLPEAINRTSSTFSPSVAEDGSIYFMEPVPPSGRFHQFRSQFRDGHYLPAEPLSFSAGADVSDCDIAVAPDESFAVFSSGRPPTGKDNIDLFIVKRVQGVWGAPVHLGAEVNSPDSDAEARLSPDLHTLYFSSNRRRPVTFPRPPGAAAEELRNTWLNSPYNIYEVDLTPWLDAKIQR